MPKRSSQRARERSRRARRTIPAPLLCIDALAAAVSKPFDEGLAIERELFMRLMQSPKSRALRHAFFAERAAARIDDLPEHTRPRADRARRVIGAGTMGTGIALAFLAAGIPVALLEIEPAGARQGRRAIRANLEGAVAKGKLARDEADRHAWALQPTLAYDDLSTADLVVEAVFEDMAIKQQVFAALDSIVKPRPILATNTSTLDVDPIAAATRRPQDVVGHALLQPRERHEAGRGRARRRDRAGRAGDVDERHEAMGKIGVVSRVCDGFIGNRMIEHYLRQAMFLLDEGASPAQVDAALERFGMAMGPFRMGDLPGLDVGWRIRQRRYVERPHVRYSRIADRLCEQGRFGQKTGAAGIATKAAGARRCPIPRSTR